MGRTVVADDEEGEALLAGAPGDCHGKCDDDSNGNDDSRFLASLLNDKQEGGNGKCRCNSNVNSNGNSRFLRFAPE